MPGIGTVAGFVSTTIYVVLTWAALEFLGLGDGTIPSWGSILYWAQQAGALGGELWWWFIPPGACIALLGAGLSLINFGIDEIADPRLTCAHCGEQITAHNVTPEAGPGFRAEVAAEELA